MEKKSTLTFVISIASSITTSSCGNIPHSPNLDPMILILDDQYESRKITEQRIQNELDEIEARLIDIMSLELNVNKSQIDSSYVGELAKSKDKLIRLVQVVEKYFSISIPGPQIEQINNLESLSNIIRDKINPPCEEQVSTYHGEQYPNSLFYTSEGHWVKIQGDIATIGLSVSYMDWGNSLVYATQLPEPNKLVKKGEEVAMFESIKAIYGVSSPLSGLVVEINHELRNCPWQIDNDPYNSGWVMKMVVSDKPEFKDLLTAKEYKEYFQTR